MDKNMMDQIKDKMLLQAKAMRHLNRTVKVSGERFDIQLSDRDINVVLYRTEQDHAPLLLGFHGGGFLFGGNAMDDAMWCAVRDALQVNVASVDYRMSPDYSSTDAIYDGYDTAVWFRTHADEAGIDGNHISVMGCSAGALLATGVCILASQKGEDWIKNQVLIYPLTDNITNPMDKVGGEMGSPADLIFQQLHCTPEQARTSLVSPITATKEELAGMPNTIICTADHDSLKAEGLQYADRLEQAGTPVAKTVANGMPHIFFEVGFGEISDAQLQAHSPELQELVRSGAAHEASVKVLEFVAENFR